MDKLRNRAGCISLNIIAVVNIIINIIGFFCRDEYSQIDMVYINKHGGLI